MPTVAISSYPPMGNKLGGSASSAVSNLQAYFDCKGAVQGSTHYQSTYTQPTYAMFQPLSLRGYLSFANYCNWTGGYPQWELAIQTPNEPRFGGNTTTPLRKVVELGAGAPEADVRTGLLATGLNPTNPGIAQNLAWAWRQSNSATRQTQDTGGANTVYQINPFISATMPRISSVQFPGYMSHMRYGFGTPNETALWFINGNFYSPNGHRDYDDGQVSIYAHSAPLAIDFTSNLTTPPVSGELIHNRVVFDAEFVPSLLAHWSDDGGSTAAPAQLYGSPTNTVFSAFANSTNSTATYLFPWDGTTWQRNVKLIDINPKYPIIYVKDIFPSGYSASAGKTLFWNLMADHTQPVAIPVSPGSVVPTARVSSCGTSPNQYPSNGTVFAIPAGLQAFKFTGYNWPAHATGGINWDLWLNVPNGDGQFYVGNWGHGPGCTTARENSEYQATNGGSGFYERQDRLVVHSTGSFVTIIAPYRKGETPDRSVTAQSCGTQITQGTESTCFDDSHLTYTNGSKQILTVYDGSTQSAFGFTASGGAQELVNDGAGTITWIISDVTAGTRTVTLPPGTWYPSIPVQQSGSSYSYYHAGGAQPTPTTITFTQNSTFMHALGLAFAAPPGATSARVKLGSSGNYAALAACDGGQCTVTFQAPSGSYVEQHDYLDLAGNVLASSAAVNVTLP